MAAPNSNTDKDMSADMEAMFIVPTLRDAQTISYRVRTHGTKEMFRQPYAEMGIVALTFGPIHEDPEQQGGYEVSAVLQAGADIEALDVAFNGILERTKYARKIREAQLADTDFRRARGELLSPDVRTEVLELGVTREVVNCDSVLPDAEIQELAL
jgi:hypothetical protein